MRSKTKKILKKLPTLAIYILVYAILFKISWLIAICILAIDLSFKPLKEFDYKGFIKKFKKPTKYKFYNSCSDLPLVNFERYLYGNDFTALVISGNPSAELMQEKGNELFSEYCELMEDEQINWLIETKNTIQKLALKVGLCQPVISVLAKLFNSELEISQDGLDTLVNILKDNGFNYDFNFHDIKGFTNDINRVKTEISGDLMLMNKLQEKINNKQKQSAETKNGLTFFDETLDAIGRHRKYHIPKKDLTVQQFCVMVKQMKEEAINNRIKERN
jgi:hypothetical protein